MDQLDKSIAQQLREVTHTADKSRYPVMTGVVKSVDTGEMTAVVLLTNDDESAPTEGVTLNVVLSNTAGVYAIPADEAHCLVAEIDGDGKWEMLKASEYKKVVITAADLVQFNDGGKGGLVEVEKLKENLDTLKDYIKNTLEPAIGSGFTAVGAAMSANGASGKTTFDGLTATMVITFEDMENTKVTHG